MPVGHASLRQRCDRVTRHRPPGASTGPPAVLRGLPQHRWSGHRHHTDAPPTHCPNVGPLRRNHRMRLSLRASVFVALITLIAASAHAQGKPKPTYYFNPEWSPDGRLLLFE